MEMKKLFLFAAIALLATACSKDDLGGGGGTTPSGPTANLFDFSTVQLVKLTVDYTACNPTGPVFFSVYSENPLNGELLNENLRPIYEGYTSANGKFDETVQLPAYAEKLYIYTGNFFISEELMVADINDLSAYAKAQGGISAARAAKGPRKAAAQTNSLATLQQLMFEVDWQTGESTGVRRYKDWVTPLGTWDSESGRPNYLLTDTDPNYNNLKFNDEEMRGIYQTITGALEDKKTCSQVYRKVGDLTLEEDAEVAVTLVGVNTCWNSSLGYYYYKEGEEPTSTMDLNIVMLFPNAQDGQSKFIAKNGNNYNGNIALNRGETVKLMYYPNIASGNLEGGTSVFPEGMRIGFILKTNAWGMQKSIGDKKFYNSYCGKLTQYGMARQYNVWGASTDGMSYCLSNADQNRYDNGTVAKANPNGECRTAKFAYANADGEQYAIVSFEDACNDEDYDDIILALKPVGVFKKIPNVEPRVTTTTGVYAFEDLWPSKGDYDMNDAVVDFKQERELTVQTVGGNYMVTKETISLTTYLNYVTLQSGLAMTLTSQKQPSSIVMKKILKTGETVDANFVKDGNVYLLTDNIEAEVNTTYVIEMNYPDGVKESQAAVVKPFIYRDEANDKRWEVHIPLEAPTAKMNMSYFDTQDDCSDLPNKRYYIREGDYPFAFFLSAVTVEPFKNTILLRANEQTPISDLYPEFLEWSKSRGTNNKDWYLHPVQH